MRWVATYIVPETLAEGYEFIQANDKHTADRMASDWCAENGVRYTGVTDLESTTEKDLLDLAKKRDA